MVVVLFWRYSVEEAKNTFASNISDFIFILDDINEVYDGLLEHLDTSFHSVDLTAIAYYVSALV